MNRLASARSAYLRSAAHQPIDWHAWGAEAFERARREGKPVLLDVGAVWCHWCHVMDRESYESAEIAKRVNEKFVAVKVDRDERPDVDARYQKLVGAITGQGGWPLTAFLTPDGDVFFGGTYFPPRDAHGRPGFPRILDAVADAWASKREDVLAQAKHLGEEVARRSAVSSPATPGAAGEEALRAGLGRILAEFDPEHGGFGGAPKFPHPGAMGFLLRRLARDPANAALKDCVTTTLRAMGDGGVYDQVGGGYHRYSVDAEWHVPHFEKMLYDNAELLRNHVHAAQLLDDPWNAAKARDVARWMMDVLAAKDGRGGFGGSQDADISLDDDGDFFTWTLDELREAVGDAEVAKVAAFHFGVTERGDMHHAPDRSVLRVEVPAEAIAEALKRPVQEVEAEIAEAKRRLARERAKRKAPFVDPTVYVSWNGMAASALLELSSALGDERAKEAALATIDRIIAEGYLDGKGFQHALGGDAVRGLLEDHAHMLRALLDAFDATAEADYLALATDVADLALDEFWSEERRAFVDLAARLHDPGARTPALSASERAVTDNPSPSAAGVLSLALVRLSRTTGNPRYEAAARRALEAGASEAARHGVFGGAMLLALDVLEHPGAHALVAASGEDLARFRGSFLAAFDPGKTLTLVAPDASQPMPDEARGLLAARAPPVAVVCVGDRCLLPATTPDELAARMREAMRGR